jgi:hypothetical protein
MAMGLPPGSRQVGVAQDFLKVDVPPRLPDDRSNPHQHRQGQPQQRVGHQWPSPQQQNYQQQLQQQAASNGQQPRNGASPQNGTASQGMQRRQTGPGLGSPTPQRQHAAPTH